MNDIKLSVIVPVYNVEKYLRRCLESLVNQTLKNIEIICVNDKSPDKSIQILREYEALYPKKVIVIDSEINLRQGGARNLGIKIAKGDYIAFIDSDDWADLTMFEKMINRTSNSKYEIIYCDYQTAEREEGPFNIVQRFESIDWKRNNIEEIKKKLIIKPSSIWSAIYSRNLFFDYNLFFPEKLFYEDNYIVPLLVAYADSIKKVDEPLVFYYTGNISVTRSFNNENFFDRVKVAKLLLEAIRKKELIEYKEELEFFFIETFYVNTTLGCLRKFFPMKLKELINICKEMEHILPDFKLNKYLIGKKNRKIEYKAYLWILMNARFILFLIYYPISLIKSFKLKRKYM